MIVVAGGHHALHTTPVAAYSLSPTNALALVNELTMPAALGAHPHQYAVAAPRRNGRCSAIQPSRPYTLPAFAITNQSVKVA